MSSHESSRDNGVRATDGKLLSSADCDEEPTDLVMNIKEEPKEDEYYEDCLNNGLTTDDQCEGLQHQDGEICDESESDYYKEINISQVAVTQDSETLHRGMGVSPCLPPSLPDGGELRPLNAVRSLSTDRARETSPSALTSRRLVPISIKTSGPIPIALTVSKPGVDPKTKSSTLNSQTSAHHLMTLATEADKILKKQEKRLKSEKGSGSDHSDEGRNSNSEEENMCSSSESSTGGVDSFLSCGDQTLTLIQRRAAEASLSSKKTKRKRNQLPDDMKDETYWERRRKNNEAAKRSRDARRAKEDQIAIRAALLEQENMRLRIEVGALKEETVRLKGMLYEKR